MLLLEDDPAVARFIAQSLSKASFTVHCATDLPEAKEALSQSDFDCLVLDRNLPSGDALDWVDDIKGNCPPVLFLTAFDSLEDRLAGLALGDDYLLKPFEIDEVIARIHALIRRSMKASTTLEGAGMIMDRVHRTVYRAGQKIDLKPMEFKLLEYLLLHKAQRVSRQMLLTHVWEYSFEPATTIVETYISRLRRKLQIADLPPAIITERGAGYRIGDV